MGGLFYAPKGAAAVEAEGASIFGPNSVGAAQRLPKVIQTGGNKIRPGTARALNDYHGLDLTKRQWGRAVEELKSEHGLRNDHHGRIWDSGDYTNAAGDVIDNLTYYID